MLIDECARESPDKTVLYYEAFTENRHNHPLQDLLKFNVINLHQNMVPVPPGHVCDAMWSA